ncbi:MAG: hypothetical protein ACM3PC_02800 [Deltaproteobacteria bacterium]
MVIRRMGLAWIIASCLVPFAARAQSVVCHEARNVFLIDAPRGWTADYEKGHELGVCAMFYPRGFTFDEAPVVVYPKLVETDEALGAFMASDLKTFSSQTANSKLLKLPPVAGPGGVRFELRRLRDGPSPTEQEIIAYHAGKGAILIAVLSARASGPIARFEPAFRTFLRKIARVPRARLYRILAAQADADLQKPGGARYESEFMTTIVPRLATVMGRCTGPRSRGFSSVLQISHDGAIAGWINERDDELSDCVRAQMRGEQGPPPPFSPFHLKLDMTTQ